MDIREVRPSLVSFYYLHTCFKEFSAYAAKTYNKAGDLILISKYKEDLG